MSRHTFLELPATVSALRHEPAKLGTQANPDASNPRSQVHAAAAPTTEQVPWPEQETPWHELTSSRHSRPDAR
jgi:hypothetical protein